MSTRLGVGFGPQTLSGLVAWYDAEYVIKDGSNRVSTWLDRSGTGDTNKNLVQAIEANQPLWNTSDVNLNGKPSITFSKARGDWMRTGAWASSPGNPCTWIIVLRHTSRDSSGSSVVMDGDDGAAGAGSRNAILIDATPKLQWASSTVQDGPVIAEPSSNVCLVIFGTSAKFYKSTHTPITGNTGAHTAERITIGADYLQSATYLLDGAIAEILAYNVAVSQTAAESLLDWAGAKYGITVGA